MKIKIDIDCTPEEARTFLGLPDVGPLQEAVMKEMQERMTTTLRSMDPEALFKTWFPGGFAGGFQGLEQLQKSLWRQFGTPGDKPGDKKEPGA
ncbi:DUF6489 family protein [Rhodospirillaceae bacterium SYSU D60014]|uniref:DUF6489 family protein n=1 Tax=Virgifigura deserti TaxID=2268457 RepID=UPI000E675798